MKKTLYALLASATLAAPAMAENWTLDNASFSPYDNHTDRDDYTFYLYKDPTTSITSVTDTIAGMTLSEFTSLVGEGYAFTYTSENGMFSRRYAAAITTTFPKDSTPYSSIWGVCVYNGEDPVFSVAKCSSSASFFGSLSYSSGGAEYTAFKSDSPATPEPATATLSLMALAGLASRRRRK